MKGRIRHSVDFGKPLSTDRHCVGRSACKSTGDRRQEDVALAETTEEIKNGFPMETQIKGCQSLEISIQSFPFIIGLLFIPTWNDNFQIDLLPTSSTVQGTTCRKPQDEGVLARTATAHRQLRRQSSVGGAR